MKKLGIIAGTGDLPKIIALEARSQGYVVSAIALDPLADRALGSFVDEIEWVNIGKFGNIIRTLKKLRIKEAVMAGKVSKSLLYEGEIIPDLRAIRFISSLKDKSDDSILRTVADEIEKEGIKLLNILSFSLDLLTPEGVLTKKPPTKHEWQDISFGWRIAKEIGRLDIGQTVVVKNQAVMAVEAIEGTDEAIRRGGKLAGKGAVIVKVSKPDQDMRFDVPVIGLDTLKAMIEVDASVLAAEVGKSIILNKDRLIEECNNTGIVLVGYKE